MYSVDGIALHNPGMGWKLRAPTRPLAELTVERTTLRVPGLPGVVPNVDDRLAALQPPTPTFVVQTPRANYEALLSLFLDGQTLGLVNDPTRRAQYEFISNSTLGIGDADAIADLTATLRIPGVFWRDTTEVTRSAALTAATITLDVWNGMSGLVTDAIIRARAPFTELEVRSRSAILRLGDLTTAGSYLRYHCGTGRAYVTTTDTWTGGTEVTGAVQSIGPGGRFAIFPTRVTPLDRRGRVTVVTATRAAATQIEIRGKGAYLA